MADAIAVENCTFAEYGVFGGVRLNAQGSADFFRAETFVEAESKSGALLRAQACQRGRKHLPNFRAAGQALGQWVRRMGDLRIEFVALPGVAPFAGADEIDRAVHGEAVKPSPEGGAAVKLGELLLGTKEAVLGDVFGIVGNAGDAVREAKDRVFLIALGQNAEIVHRSLC